MDTQRSRLTRFKNKPSKPPTDRTCLPPSPPICQGDAARRAQSDAYSGIRITADYAPIAFDNQTLALKA